MRCRGLSASRLLWITRASAAFACIIWWCGLCRATVIAFKMLCSVLYILYNISTFAKLWNNREKVEKKASPFFAQRTSARKWPDERETYLKASILLCMCRGYSLYRETSIYIYIYCISVEIPFITYYLHVEFVVCKIRCLYFGENNHNSLYSGTDIYIFL